MLKKIFIFLCVVMTISVKAKAESPGTIKNEAWPFMNWVKNAEVYEGLKVKEVLAGNIYLDTYEKTHTGSKKILNVELKPGLFHHEFQKGDFVDFYGSVRDAASYTQDGELITFRDGGISPLPRIRMDTQLQANVFDQNGNHSIINHPLLKFPYRNVSVQEIDLRIRKMLVEKEGWYKAFDNSKIKGKIGIHFKDGSERFIYLNRLYDYRTNEHIDITSINHFDLYLGEKYID